MTKTLVNPSKDQTGSGLSSTISFEHDDYMRAMRIMFHCTDEEVISQIEINKYGITARISNK